MQLKITPKIKKGDVIYTIEKCKIEKYYVESLGFCGLPEFGKDISPLVSVHLERYSEPENSFKTTKPLSQCFLSKEELINQL